jgi:TatD family-associated radical SAM protein
LSGYLLKLKKEPTMDELWKELQREVHPSDREVVWCGFGEPTTRLDLILELTRRIKEKYPHVQVRLDTDGQGQLRYKSRSVASELKKAGVDRISISLNAENAQKYNVLCNPSYPNAYDAILSFAKDCKKYFSTVRLSVVGGTDADVSECARIAGQIGCEFVVR